MNRKYRYLLLIPVVIIAATLWWGADPADPQVVEEWPLYDAHSLSAYVEVLEKVPPVYAPSKAVPQRLNPETGEGAPTELR